MFDTRPAEARNMATGDNTMPFQRSLGFTRRQLLLATGGAPIRPELPGIDLPFIQGVQTLGDAERLLGLADQGTRRTVIVGGGYIGLEMAEAFIERGYGATVLERNAQPLSLLDDDSWPTGLGRLVPARGAV